MPNKVEPGMRFRWRTRKETVVFTAIEKSYGEYWLCSRTDQPETCNAGVEDTKYFEPIPEPAPELCAWGDRCGRPRSSMEHECNTEICWGADHGGCKRNNAGCHNFVTPQAKPVMSPAQQQIAEAVKAANQQAKPVLREPKPCADGYPDVCLECRGEKPGRNFTCSGCFSLLPIPDFNRLTAGWRASQAKPAAKDIPSRLTAAARALDRKIDTNETGPSAVAAAPAIEPWRPSVDDWDLLADAETGWRR